MAGRRTKRDRTTRTAPLPPPDAPRRLSFHESTDTHVVCAACGKDEPLPAERREWRVIGPAGWMVRQTPVELAEAAEGAPVLSFTCSEACADAFDEEMADWRRARVGHRWGPSKGRA